MSDPRRLPISRGEFCITILNRVFQKVTLPNPIDFEIVSDLYSRTFSFFHVDRHYSALPLCHIKL